MMRTCLSLPTIVAASNARFRGRWRLDSAFSKHVCYLRKDWKTGFSLLKESIGYY
jgi:hypothetical protein